MGLRKIYNMNTTITAKLGWSIITYEAWVRFWIRVWVRVRVRDSAIFEKVRCGVRQLKNY